MGIITFPKEKSGVDSTLSSQLSAFGSFPFTNEADVRIESYTEWDDIEGYRKVGVLTIGAGQQLRITRSPFIIFAKQIIFESTTSTINASGWHGTEYSRYASTSYATGGFINQLGSVHGGCGGGMLLIVTDRVSGAQGSISANGGNGAIVSLPPFTGSGGVWFNCSGQGALSYIRPAQNQSTGGGSTPSIDLRLSIAPYSVTTVQDTLRANIGSQEFMGPAGAYQPAGTQIPAVRGGASGAGTSGQAGSGFGSGGSVAASLSSGATVNGVSASSLVPIHMLIPLWDLGCRGGGGGASMVNLMLSSGNWSTAAAAGGGGGGLIHVWARALEVVPIMTANGGTGQKASSSVYPGTVAGNGAAGQILITRV